MARYPTFKYAGPNQTMPAPRQARKASDIPSSLGSMPPPADDFGAGTDPNQNVAQAALTNAGGWWDNPLTRAGAWVLDNTGNAWNKFINPQANQDATKDAVVAPGPVALSPKQVAQLHQMASAQGMDSAVIDGMISDYGNAPGGYTKIMDSILQQQTQNAQVGALSSFYDPAIADARDQSARLHGIATDPNKALSDAEFGARYSAGKEQLDNLINMGELKSREQQASRTGGALTGRGLSTATQYDIARQTGKQQLTSGLLGEAQGRADDWQRYGNQLGTDYTHSRLGVLGSFTPRPSDAYDSGVAVRAAAAGRNAVSAGAGVNALTGVINTGGNLASQATDTISSTLSGIPGLRNLPGVRRSKGGVPGSSNLGAAPSSNLGGIPAPAASSGTRPY